MHLTEQDLADFAARRMVPHRIRAAGAHVRSCDVCAAAVDRSRTLARSAAELWEQATAEEQESTPMPPRRWWPAAALAATLAAAAGTWLFLKAPAIAPPPPPIVRPQPPVAAATPLVVRDGPYSIRVSGAAADVEYGRAEWNALVREAVASKRIPVARIAALHPAGEHVRGSGEEQDGATLAEPRGVVASQRPELRWRGPAGAEYKVTIAGEDGTVVAQSGSLRTTSWTPPRPLARGLIYQWQLAVREPSGRTAVVPMPPAPPALFAILSADAAREAEEARSRGAHLVAALLYARHGAGADAERELQAFAAENPASPLAAALQRSVASQWQ
ncbi:MAG TPA: hypothetical protein VEK57_15830 [Thermoanaerobaculia bacterium]|nr:hypothetical protein [Thermoanaerobaculia bacterium]